MRFDARSVRRGIGFGAAEQNASILVVDDEPSSQHVLVTTLRRAGFINVNVAHSLFSGLAAYDKHQPDLLILDLHLPDGTGTTLLNKVKQRVGPDAFLPVLMLTGDPTDDACDSALAAGATDFLSKPYRASELLLRVHNLLRTRMMHIELREQFVERSRELEDARLEILERLARVAEQRDDGAHGHIRRVGALSALIAEELGCGPVLVDHIRRAAPLHDVGKIGIRDEILLKQGPLEPAEFRAQERHTLIGAHILANGGFSVIQMAEEIARTHHERWDGKGYPHGLKGEAIPLAGRITAVADMFDALVHPRPYKPAWPVEDALIEIKEGSGTRFDPVVVQALLRVIALQDMDALIPAQAKVLMSA